MSALTSGVKRKTVLLGGKTLEAVDKFRYLGAMFIANSQGIEEISSITNLALPAISHLVFGRAVN